MSDCRAPTLRGFASIEITEMGSTIHDLAIHENDSACSVDAFAGGIS